MPSREYNKMRRSLKVLGFFCSACITGLLLLAIASALQGYVVGAISVILLGSCIGLLVLMISGPLLFHNVLTIYADCLVPLRRPIFSPPNRPIPLSEISRIDAGGFGGHKDEIYQFDIWIKNGSHFTVNSMTLARYDSSEVSAKRVFQALTRIKREVELRTTASKRGHLARGGS